MHGGREGEGQGGVSQHLPLPSAWFAGEQGYGLVSMVWGTRTRPCNGIGSHAGLGWDRPK